MSPFEEELSVTTEELELVIKFPPHVEWENFLLNPRRLRGSDFLMRWSQGVWSEKRIIDAVNASEKYYALPYGPSSTAPKDDVRAFELYFERLEAAGLRDMKRPDILIFEREDAQTISEHVSRLGGADELPFTPEDNELMQAILSHAIVALESENSLWKAAQMPAYGTPLRPMARLGGKMGLQKNAVVPTIIVKEEDRKPLEAWQSLHGIKIHVWHVFYDMAFGISLDEINRLIGDDTIEPTVQVYQAPGGATTRKTIYKILYHHSYKIGDAVGTPELQAESIVDANGHILPYVRFEGGMLRLIPGAIAVLDNLAKIHAENKAAN